MKIKTVLLDCQKKNYLQMFILKTFLVLHSLSNQVKITSKEINCRISFLNFAINEASVIEDYLSGEIVIEVIKASLL